MDVLLSKDSSVRHEDSSVLSKNSSVLAGRSEGGAVSVNSGGSCFTWLNILIILSGTCTMLGNSSMFWLARIADAFLAGAVLLPECGLLLQPLLFSISSTLLT
jgi:hypothetical protein